MSSPLYVYGVVAAGAEGVAGLEGVGGAGTALVEEGTLAALVSPLPRPEVRARRRDLKAHLAVLEAACERTTVVPCRFGTVFDSAESVREELLAAGRDELAASLARLAGRVQLRLTVAYDEEAVLREVVADEPEVARLRSLTRTGRGEALYAARVRLGELVATAVELRRERDAEAIAAEVAPLVDVVLVEEPGVGRVLKASLLVERTRVGAVERRLEELAAAGGGRLRFELLGPLPPTAFAEPVEAAAWA